MTKKDKRTYLGLLAVPLVAAVGFALYCWSNYSAKYSRLTAAGETSQSSEELSEIWLDLLLGISVGSIVIFFAVFALVVVIGIIIDQWGTLFPRSLPVKK